ncbi:uncharacterized protein FFB20_01512 [Fusarium fujikuroi]|nr:uncharacterized protein Y057_4438 [Fusarium fujikuroi]QGI85357.1 hypothetical protein CEK25_012086 [Fusarium fujikuroi]SCN65295.1 uncharacterized protein FFB20_01512 [Fusarium fujikuroi]SCO12508.1 uncharacterized protein FFC1_11785 [Fusarium fujikuroi]SCO15364.1 uncharacterized protein FFE2_13291 [Fusarium fujikuroi]
MQHWYQRALAKGRTPLPDSSGARPWVSQEPTVSELEVSNQQERRSNGDGKPSTDTAVQINEPASTTTTAAAGVDQSYRFWTESDLHRFIEMRNGSAKWSAIALEFPDRTLEALKQTYHKRRHTVE